MGRYSEADIPDAIFLSFPVGDTIQINTDLKSIVAREDRRDPATAPPIPLLPVLPDLISRAAQNPNNATTDNNSASSRQRKANCPMTTPVNTSTSSTSSTNSTNSTIPIHSAINSTTSTTTSGTVDRPALSTPGHTPQVTLDVLTKGLERIVANLMPIEQRRGAANVYGQLRLEKQALYALHLVDMVLLKVFLESHAVQKLYAASNPSESAPSNSITGSCPGLVVRLPQLGTAGHLRTIALHENESAREALRRIFPGVGQPLGSGAPTSLGDGAAKASSGQCSSPRGYVDAFVEEPHLAKRGCSLLGDLIAIVGDAKILRRAQDMKALAFKYEYGGSRQGRGGDLLLGLAQLVAHALASSSTSANSNRDANNVWHQKICISASNAHEFPEDDLRNLLSRAQRLNTVQTQASAQPYATQPLGHLSKEQLCSALASVRIPALPYYDDGRAILDLLKLKKRHQQMAI